MIVKNRKGLNLTLLCDVKACGASTPLVRQVPAYEGASYTHSGLHPEAEGWLLMTTRGALRKTTTLLTFPGLDLCPTCSRVAFDAFAGIVELAHGANLAAVLPELEQARARKALEDLMTKLKQLPLEPPAERKDEAP